MALWSTFSSGAPVNTYICSVDRKSAETPSIGQRLGKTLMYLYYIYVLAQTRFVERSLCTLAHIIFFIFFITIIIIFLFPHLPHAALIHLDRSYSISTRIPCIHACSPTTFAHDCSRPDAGEPSTRNSMRSTCLEHITPKFYGKHEDVRLEAVSRVHCRFYFSYFSSQVGENHS